MANEYTRHWGSNGSEVPELGPVHLGIRNEHGHSGGLAGLQGGIGLVLSLLLRPNPLHHRIKLLVWTPRAAQHTKSVPRQVILALTWLASWSVTVSRATQSVQLVQA